MATGGWAVLAVMVWLVLWAVSVYRQMRQLHARVEAAYALLDVQLALRYDLIPKLAEAARSALAPEAPLLDAVVRASSQARGAATTARRHPGQPGAMGALSMAEQQLMAQLQPLQQRIQAPSLLQAAPGVQPLCSALAATEAQIAQARQTYNLHVRDYNLCVRGFPELLLAPWLGFAPLDMLVPAIGEAGGSWPTPVA